MTSTPVLVRKSPAAAPARKRKAPGEYVKGDGRAALLFLLPAIIGFVLFYIYPSIRGIWYSMTDWTMLSAPTFVGADNYTKLIHDPQYWSSVWVTIQFVIMTLVSQLVLALILAGIMHRLTRSVIVRAVLLVPWLVPNVTIGLLWMWVLDTNLGFLNNLIRALGGSTTGFLTAPSLALGSVAGITTWAGVGYVSLLFYAGMLQIPSELYESASLDGAGEMRMFFRITLPLLRPIIALVLVVSVIGSFQVFDVVAVTTAGRPLGLTRVIYFYIYEEAFRRFRMGYASAMALSLVLLLGTLTVIQFRLLRASSTDLG